MFSILGLNAFDAAIMTFIQENFHNAFTDVFFVIVTHMGDKGIIWIVACLPLLFFKKTRVCGIVFAFSLIFTFIFSEVILKNIVQRPRPFIDFPDFTNLLITAPHGFSFPSSHASSSFACATSLFLYYRKAGIAALVLATLIAFSRIFLFVHYPTDVITGALLGIGFAIITNIIVKKQFKRGYHDK